MDLALEMIIQRNHEELLYLHSPKTYCGSLYLIQNGLKPTKCGNPEGCNKKYGFGDGEAAVFFSVLNFDLNHWCAVAVDFNSTEVNIYDPQQIGDRFKIPEGGAVPTAATARNTQAISI